MAILKGKCVLYKDVSFSELVSQLNWKLYKKKKCCPNVWNGFLFFSFFLPTSKQRGRFSPPFSTLGRKGSKSPCAPRSVQLQQRAPHTVEQLSCFSQWREQNLHPELICFTQLPVVSSKSCFSSTAGSTSLCVQLQRSSKCTSQSLPKTLRGIPKLQLYTKACSPLWCLMLRCSAQVVTQVVICPARDPEDTDLHLLGRSGDLTVGHAWSSVCGSSREEQHHLLTKNVMVCWMTGFWTCVSV